jgi:hypothetical protein
VVFENAFELIHRDAWGINGYKWGRKGLRDNMVKCIREMDDGLKICVKWGYDEVTDCIE